MMPRLIAVALATLSLLASSAAGQNAEEQPAEDAVAEDAVADEDGFTPIFDGESLDGWDGNPKFWRVSLASTGKADIMFATDYRLFHEASARFPFRFGFDRQQLLGGRTTEHCFRDRRRLGLAPCLDLWQ